MAEGCLASSYPRQYIPCCVYVIPSFKKFRTCWGVHKVHFLPPYPKSQTQAQLFALVQHPPSYPHHFHHPYYYSTLPLPPTVQVAQQQQQPHHPHLVTSAPRNSPWPRRGRNSRPASAPCPAPSRSAAGCRRRRRTCPRPRGCRRGLRSGQS